MIDPIITASYASTTNKTEPATKKQVHGENELTETDVTLTPKLTHLASTLTETEEHDEAAHAEKLSSLKHLINHDEYKLDMKALAHRLAQSGLMN